MDVEGVPRGPTARGLGRIRPIDNVARARRARLIRGPARGFEREAARVRAARKLGSFLSVDRDAPGRHLANRDGVLEARHAAPEKPVVAVFGGLDGLDHDLGTLRIAGDSPETRTCRSGRSRRRRGPPIAGPCSDPRPRRTLRTDAPRGGAGSPPARRRGTLRMCRRTRRSERRTLRAPPRRARASRLRRHVRRRNPTTLRGRARRRATHPGEGPSGRPPDSEVSPRSRRAKTRRARARPRLPPRSRASRGTAIDRERRRIRDS